MFQSTQRMQSPEGNDPQKQEQQKRDQQAQDAVAEAQLRMMNDAQVRGMELQRQTIEGRVEEVRAKDHQGASAQQVAERAKENTLGTIDFDLARLTPPSFNEDRRQEIRMEYMRAVAVEAREIEARKVEQETTGLAQAHSAAERERRDRELAPSS